jgi:hypothetical protein
MSLSSGYDVATTVLPTYRNLVAELWYISRNMKVACDDATTVNIRPSILSDGQVVSFFHHCLVSVVTNSQQE